MDSVIRAVAIYAFLLILFRISGRRTLSELTNFDLVLLLIVSEATQQALIGEDYSMTGAMLVILTLVSADVALTLFKQRAPRLEKWLEGLPTIVVEDGKPLLDVMHRARIDESDILSAARELQGLERMDQIKFAVLERSGGLSIIPKPDARA